MRRLKYSLGLLVSLLFVQPAAYGLEVDELLLDRLVEKGTLTAEESADIRAEAALKTQEEVTQKKKFGVEGKTKIDLSGYLQEQYVADWTSAKFDGFNIRRARLDFRGRVSKEVGWRLQLDAVQPLKSVTEKVTQNSTTKNITTATTRVVTRPVLLDAYLDYQLPLVNLRVGQFKLPFGQENLESSPKLDTINRSQVTEKIVPGRDIGSQGRDIGVQLSGEFTFGTRTKILEYVLGIFNGAGVNITDDNEYKDSVGRVLVFPVQGLSVGLAYYNGKSGTTKIGKVRTGAEVVYLVGNLSLKAEYVNGQDGAVEKDGWYAQAGYKFLAQLEMVVKYDCYDPDKNKAQDRTEVATLGLNWFISKAAKIQADYEWKIEQGTAVSNNVFLTQFQVQF